MTPMQHPKEGPPVDRGTQLAEERTSLAQNRNFLAAERTLMAWIRTALSMISFGFTMIKFFDYLASTQRSVVGPLGRTWTPSAVGFSLMAIGTTSLFVAVLMHRQQLKALRKEGLESKWSLAFVVAALVAVLGLFALVSLLLGH